MSWTVYTLYCQAAKGPGLALPCSSAPLLDTRWCAAAEMDIETWAGATAELSTLLSGLSGLRPDVPTTSASIYDLNNSVSSFGTRTASLRRGDAAAPTAAERTAFCRCAAGVGCFLYPTVCCPQLPA